MPTASTSKKPSKRSKKASAGKARAGKGSEEKTTKLGRTLSESLRQAAAHFRGEIELPTYIVINRVDVRAVRESTGLSQAEFARKFALSTRTLQEWEQGRTEPDTVARAYLTVISKIPKAVEDALRAD